jgi:16S rRNA G966 N2-methylase RsmD
MRVAAVLLVALASLAPAAEPERTGGPFVPTPQSVVDAMLEMAQVGADDLVIDLGSGDGRIVFTAAQRYSARGLGVDIDPELVKQSNAEAQRRGLSERVSFREEDALKARIDDATVVTLYLLPGMMQELQTKFARELKPGTRIVSHDFPFGEWKPDRQVSIEVPEKYGTAGRWTSTIYYWVVPAQVQGTWQVSAPGLLAQALSLTLQQQYQYIRGAIVEDGSRVPIAGGKIEAGRISFKATLPRGAYEFSGLVEGERMRGDAVLEGGPSIPWSAVKTAVPSVIAR